MKHLALILLLATSVQAQQRVALTKVVWAPEPIWFSAAAYEDGQTGCIGANTDGKLWHVTYELPFTDRLPDSLTFIMSANVEVYFFSSWNLGNQRLLGRAKNFSGSITVPYSYTNEPYGVGVGVGLDSKGFPQRGDMCVDGAYAVYNSASVDMPERLLSVFPLDWYDETGRWVFAGTRKDLEKSNLRGTFFSIGGKYHRK